jgi:hypothetical protein
LRVRVRAAAAAARACAVCRLRSCTPPPARANDACFSLHGEGGLKALRAALLSTPEWNTGTAREAAARACETDGLAAVLRARAARQLSKSMLLELCRLWAYRSNVWCARAPGRAHCAYDTAAAVQLYRFSPARF